MGMVPFRNLVVLHLLGRRRRGDEKHGQQAGGEERTVRSAVLVHGDLHVVAEVISSCPHI
jgi:hypothetical protein